MATMSADVQASPLKPTELDATLPEEDGASKTGFDGIQLALLVIKLNFSKTIILGSKKVVQNGIYHRMQLM